MDNDGQSREPSLDADGWMAIVARARAGDVTALDWVMARGESHLWEASKHGAELSNDERLLATAVKTAVARSRAEFANFKGDTCADLGTWFESQLDRALAECDQHELTGVGSQSGGDVTTFSLNLPEGTSELPDGKEIKVGRFEIRRVLGSGGMGRVYLAHDPALHRVVALKIPHSNILADEGTRSQFLREAHASGMLRHPNIVLVYESGEVDGICYIASQYCAGPTLAEWLAQRDRPVPVRTAARIVAALAVAMQHAHDRGVLHRDLKPSNVLLDPVCDVEASASMVEADFPYVPRITDFGLARIEEDEGTLVQTGVAFGTVAYMAPEQAYGEREHLGPRTDVYALGVLLYKLLTGRNPYHKNSLAATLAAVQQGAATAPRRLRRDIPRDLDSITMRAMAAERESRYAASGQLAEDLDRFLLGLPTAARPVSPPRRVLKWARRRPAIATLAAFAHLVFFATLAAIVWHNYVLGKSATELAQLKIDNEKARALTHDTQQHLRDELYATDISLAFRARQEGDSRQAAALLARYLPSGELARFSGAPMPVSFGQRDNSQAETLRRSYQRGWEWYWLWNQVIANADSITLTATSLYCVAWAPDGRTVATGGQDGILRFVDPTELVITTSINSQQQEINCIAFAQHHNWVATGGDDGTVRIWNTDNDRQEHRFDVSDAKIFGIDLIDDDRKLIACSDDAVIRIWNVASGKLIHELTGHHRSVEAICVRNDERILASAGSDETVRIWDLQTGRLLQTLELAGHRVGAVAFSANGQLAAGDIDGNVRVWSANDHRLIQSFNLLDGVQTIAFSPDSGWLTVGTKAGDIHHRQLPLQKASQSAGNTLVSAEALRQYSWQAHQSRVYMARVAPSGQRWASVGNEGQLKLWRPRYENASLRPYFTDREVNTVTRIPGTQQVLAVGPRNLEVYNRTGEVAQIVGSAPAPNIERLAIAHDGRQIAAAGKERLYFGTLAAGLEPAAMRLGAWIRQLEFTRDGRYLVANVGRKAIVFIDTVTRRVGRSLPLEDSYQFVLSHDGKWLVAGDQNDLVIWQIDSTAAPRRVSAHEGTIRTLAINPSGTLLATAGNDRQIRIWQWPSCEPAGLLQQPRVPTRHLVFSTDGRTIFSSDMQGVVHVWHVASGRSLFELNLTASRILAGPEHGQLTGREPSGHLWFINLVRSAASM